MLLTVLYRKGEAGREQANLLATALNEGVYRDSQ